MNETKEQIFDRLRAIVPVFNRHSSPLGGGNFALAVDMNDGTVIKAFRAWKKNQDLGQILLRNEVACLDFLGGRVGDYHSPRIVEPPTIFENPDSGFSGYFRMTKLSGTMADWPKLMSEESPHKIQKHGAQLGSLIATLHHEADRSGSLLPSAIKNYGTGIYAVWIKDAELKRITLECDKWAQRRCRNGFAHLDIADRNIMVDDRGNVTGILDFSISGNHPNPLIDFGEIPDMMLQSAFHTFKQVSGRNVDPLMLEMTRLSHKAEEISHIWHDPYRENERDKRAAEFMQAAHKLAYQIGVV